MTPTPSSSGAAWASGLVQPWRERGTVLCREAAAPTGCIEQTFTSTDCELVVDPNTGEPVKRCVKLYKRYLKCHGRPEQVDEQKQELMARGEGAQRLEPNLVELPSRLLPGPGPSGAVGEGAAKMEDVGHVFEEFLRFAEELQEQMVPGAMHLDQAPPAAAQPYCEPDAAPQQQEQEPAAGGQQQLVGGLLGRLFGKRRAAQDGGSGSRLRRVDSSTWKEFEKDFVDC